MKTQRLFFDDLVDLYHREAEASKTEIGREVAKNIGKILNASRIFLINSAVVDDLYHVPHDNTDYNQTFHLPFPAIFFELRSPLEIALTQERRVRGILYGKMEDGDTFQSKDKGIPSDQFVMNVFYDDVTKRRAFPDSVYFRTSQLPNLVLLTDEVFFMNIPQKQESSQRLEKTVKKSIN